MKLALARFRVCNFRNIDDSDWIPVEGVTALVGRNESGKTAILKALHKFNPAVPEPYDPQREFPRDRYTAEYRSDGNLPVCEAEFIPSAEFQKELAALADGYSPPSKVTCVRHYNGVLAITTDSRLPDDSVGASELGTALDVFRRKVRRIRAEAPEQEEATAQLRSTLCEWATLQKDASKQLDDLRCKEGLQLLGSVRQQASAKSYPQATDAIAELIDALESLLDRSKAPRLVDRLHEEISKALPAFIYFENYGILDSAVFLPRFLEDLKREPNAPKVRTINAMFKHVGLDASELARLGRHNLVGAHGTPRLPTESELESITRQLELRTIKLNSASLAITSQFNEWYGQRRHKIRYQADGDYFRIWVSDDKRPDVDIELESRSKGFQWFFSFYLVFLVESQEGHRDAILLLDEPGLHLHPTAQQELIAFFERLSETNPLIYSTHSPFLIDGEHIHRVRPVKEDETGHAQVTWDTWPADRETLFPLQAAAGYAMVRGLFQHHQNVLVEGISDYLYLHSLSMLCRAVGLSALSDDVYITPCGGTKNMGHIAALFLGHRVRPVVLLDSDDAGRARQTALLKDLYKDRETAVLPLGEVLGLAECEIEDLVGEQVLLPHLCELLRAEILLTDADRSAGGVVDWIQAAARRLAFELPDGWRPELARRIVVAWSTTAPNDIPGDVLKRAESLFVALGERFTRARL